MDSAIIGGTESSDAFSLNVALTALPGNRGALIYDPGSCSVGSRPGGCFNATTSPLRPGIYTLNLAMRDSVNLQLTVPEPDTTLMLGVGLVALLCFRRKRNPGTRL